MTHTTTAPSPEIEREAFTVAEFCQSIGISRAFFYKLLPAQRPQVMRLGRRVLITREAAIGWRRRLEAQSAEGTA